MKKLRKTISIIMAVLLIVSVFPISAAAEKPSPNISGYIKDEGVINSKDSEAVNVTVKSQQDLFADVTRKYNVGDTFTLAVNLDMKGQDPIDTQFRTLFDSNALKVTAQTINPILKLASTTNISEATQKEKNAVFYNFSTSEGCGLTTKSTIVTYTVEVLNVPGTSQTMTLDYQLLNAVNADPTQDPIKYIDQKAADGNEGPGYVQSGAENLFEVSVDVSASTVVPTEPTTQAPTQEPTQAPTQEPTEAPTIVSGAEATDSGTTGYCTWSYYSSTGLLTISGSGAMGNYSSTETAPWYTYIDEIKTVEIKSGVTNIGKYAFDSCSSLEYVTIPNSVTSIGSCAFNSCTSLTEVYIPESVTSIGNYVFDYCESLENIAVSGSNNYYSGLLGVLFNKDKSTLIRYPANKSDTFYPIPSTVVTIEKAAFGCCANLIDVIIPDSVTTICDYAFDECINLADITIGSSVTTINDGAFYDCESLTNVTIPSSVTSIGQDVFYKCTSLTEITVSPYNASYASDNGILFNSDKTRLMCYPAKKSGTSYSVPNNVTDIDGTAFVYCSQLTSVTIPNGITEIKNWTFGHCPNLQKVIIPDSVTAIGAYTFFDCTSLTDIAIPENVTSIGKQAFCYCESLTSITLPEGITEINDWTFGYCENLQNITIPDSVTAIGFSVFFGNSSLTNINIPANVTSIGKQAFCYCDSLKKITIPENVASIGDYTFFSCSDLASVTIGKKLSSIGKNAFGSCLSLKDVYYQGTEQEWNNISIDSSNSILTGATIHYNSDPSALTGGTTGDCTWEFDASTGKLTISGSGAMGNYSSTEAAPWDTYSNEIKTVEIKSGVTSIGDFAFSFCSNLTNVTLPNSVTSIGEYAFYYCTGLTNITLPNSLKSIGEDAFYKCSSLTNVTIPNSVTVINSFAFTYCTGLTQINIPSGVISIGNYVFDFCSNLSSITVSGSNSTYSDEDGVLFNKGKTTLIRYPAGKSAESYSVPDSVTTIDTGSFNCCTNLTDITIPDSVTTIGMFAFENCSNLNDVYYTGTEEEWNNISIGYDNENLTEATIHFNSNTSTASDSGTTGSCTWSYYSSNGLLKISGSGAMGNYTSDDLPPWYSYAENIKTIKIESGVTDIGDFAFYECEAATSVTIPTTVTSIGNGAFWQCAGLTNVTIPEKVNTIGEEVFFGCVNLTEIIVSNNNSYFVSQDGILFNKNKTKLICYPSNKAGTSYTVPSTVTIIDSCAFVYCYNLEEIIIFEGVTDFYQFAFAACKNLKSITIPKSIENIESYAFYYNISLEDVYYGGTSQEWNNIYIGEENEYLTGATIHYNSNSSALTSGTTGDCTWEFDASTGKLTISGNGKMADYSSDNLPPWFSYRRSILSVYVTYGVENLGDYAFFDCANLPGLTLGNTIKTIGKLTFGECTGFTNFTIPSSITSIGNMAFFDCINLQSLSIPESITTINLGAFAGCSKLTSVTIPKTVNTIGEYAFGYDFDSDNQLYKTDNFTIYGSRETAAQSYALVNGFKFVSVDKTTVTLAKSSGTVYVGSTITIDATVTNAVGATTYTSENTAVAKVNSGGVVTGVGAGTTYIVVKNNGVSQRFMVTVNKIKPTIMGVQSSYTKTYGSKAFSLGAKTSGNGKLSYSSSNSKVVTVSASGKVAIKGCGKAYITISSSSTSKYVGVSKKITINVKPKKLSFTSIKKSGKKTIQIKYKKQPNCSGYTLEYSTRSNFSSKKSIYLSAKTSKVKLKGLKSGKTYYIRLRGYVKTSGKTLYGSWAKVKITLK
ncbi:MAG: leucine-rich repeat protein [Ruminococcus sp.]